MKGKTIAGTVLFLASIWFLNVLHAQPGNVDERARELVSLGKKYYQTKSFLDAAITFELATQRPANDLSSFCQYMTGLSFYRYGDKDKAVLAFDKLMAKFPKSVYLDDARYHKALILMESGKVNDRERGLDEMFRLLESSKDKNLKADVEESTRHFLTNVYDPTFLNLYFVFVKEAFKPMVMEAICTQYDKAGDGYRVVEKLKEYQSKGGLMTSYLSDLKSKYESGGKGHSNRLNVAVFLSFNLQLVDTAHSVPARSEKGLEMYEGMLMALDSTGKSLNKQVNLRAFDTQGDTLQLRGQLDELRQFQPDVIIGDIRTGLASIISDWAEKNKVVHIIPRNPLTELITNKKYTFLAHPSTATHGKRMAQYLVEQEGKHKFIIFNDQSFFSNLFASAFKKSLSELPGVTVVEKIIPSRYKEVQDQVSREIKAMKGQGFDAVYVPLASEEAAGLIISTLNYHGITADVIGGPDWETFSVIDGELKSAYNLKYSSFYYENNDSTAYDQFYSLCLQQYGYPPSSYTVQGFDIMAWLLSLSKGDSGTSNVAELIHKSPGYRGIHQDFFFGNHQDNQEVNIVQFKHGRIDKVNRDQKEPGFVPGGEKGNPRGGK